MVYYRLVMRVFLRLRHTRELKDSHLALAEKLIMNIPPDWELEKSQLGRKTSNIYGI